jgi:23S rRNA (cytosine1962-C5)-methyltransferase
MPSGPSQGSASSKVEPPVVALKSDQLNSGPWVFARQVSTPDPPLPAGALVEVHDASGRFVGHALYNEVSDIRLRMLSRGRRSDLARPREFLLRRIKNADDLRRKVLRLSDVCDAYRIVHAEGDDLPGLIVDRLGAYLVCEHHSVGFWNLRGELEWALNQLYPDFEVLHRFARSAARSEGFESVEPEADPGPTTLREHGCTFVVVPAGGHKTGWFCDQRDNRQRVAELCRGRELLDLCCNAGGFALHARARGAQKVTAVDLDEVVLERARRSAEMNELEIEFVHADAFDLLRSVRAQTRRPDFIVLDPHKLIPNKTRMDEGLAKYNDLNTLALEAARPGGLLATFSCSGLLTESAFIGMLFASARRAGRGVRLLERFEAAPDHPQRPEFPRSRYLKGALLHVD